ncbi:unnamed protein product [Triticum turgidum subsp. durum]|uniref:RING-type E3 ubiquitin transferase n=1 Tax=Triticum turgidum subsp. durum TaxID=4567 RepID=A0A9R1BYV0_TRITD|nr:unnamed protein product [Triticum turgidum subsp. durum]
MASPYLLHRLTADEIFQTLEASSSTSSSCYDAFVPVFRPDPSSSSLSVSAADRVRSQFLSVERDLFHDALVAPRNDDLGFPEENDEEEEASIRWDCFQLDEEEEPDLPLEASVSAEEFDWEEVAFASGPLVENPEPDWEVLVAVGDGLFLTNKPPAARSAVKALPSAILAAGEEGEGEECSVCKDGVVAGERVKMMPCSHRYHEDCILPWLEVRNSCPLCRFELPTDNPKYETWKAGRAMAT